MGNDSCAYGGLSVKKRSNNGKANGKELVLKVSATNKKAWLLEFDSLEQCLFCRRKPFVKEERLREYCLLAVIPKAFIK